MRLHLLLAAAALLAAPGVIQGQSQSCDGNCTNGYGRMSFSSGQVQEGQWRDGKQHGAAATLYASGARHIGLFVDGEREGRGIYWQGDGEYVIMGDFEDGQPGESLIRFEADGDVVRFNRFGGERDGREVKGRSAKLEKLRLVLNQALFDARGDYVWLQVSSFMGDWHAYAPTESDESVDFPVAGIRARAVSGGVRIRCLDGEACIQDENGKHVSYTFPASDPEAAAAALNSARDVQIAG